MKFSYSDSFIGEKQLAQFEIRLAEAHEKLHCGAEAFTGWAGLPAEYDKEETERILKISMKIRKQCEAFIVIGVGGSYLGARACIEMLKHTFGNLLEPGDRQTPQIFFAGHNISGTYHAELLEIIENKEVCLCVISKSGTTIEPNIAFSILKEMMAKKYGASMHERIYVITDREKGILREETSREGYESFIVPDDIGGRYSVLTAVGLLPIAVSGIDIGKILEGAAAACDEYGEKGMANPCWQYAAARRLLNESGKVIEVFEYYEPKLQYFAEWLKQLFGESEGKNGKGIFPASLQFSTDLHSMGQFLQEGNQCFFETVLNVSEPEKDLPVPESAVESLRGKSMNDINRIAVEGVILAHVRDSIPNLRIDIPKLTPYYFGKAVYFFEKACALSAYLLDVNPFDQPGVEAYKKSMQKLLND